MPDFIQPRIQNEAVRRIREHRRRGDRVILVTGALDFLVDSLRHLGDDLIAARLVEKTGRFTGELAEPPLTATGGPRWPRGSPPTRRRSRRLPRVRRQPADLPLLELVGPARDQPGLPALARGPQSGGRSRRGRRQRRSPSDARADLHPDGRATCVAPRQRAQAGGRPPAALPGPLARRARGSAASAAPTRRCSTARPRCTSPLTSASVRPRPRDRGELISGRATASASSSSPRSAAPCAASSRRAPSARRPAALCRHTIDGTISAGLQTGYCRDSGGGWSEGLVAHAAQLHTVPDDLPDEDAVLVEPLACALHAAAIADVRAGRATSRSSAPARSAC